jgi:hypothetical protein
MTTTNTNTPKKNCICRASHGSDGAQSNPLPYRHQLPNGAHRPYNNVWLDRFLIGTYFGRFLRLRARAACRAQRACLEPRSPPWAVKWPRSKHHWASSCSLARLMAFHRLKRARRSASGEVGEERGTVRITASEVVGSEVLPSILAAIHAIYPGISVELALSNRNEDLLRGDADIAVRMVRPTQDALVAKRIGRIDVGLYGHRRYLKGREMPLRMADLGQHALIGYDRDQRYARLLESMGVPSTGEMFAFRSDSDLAQLAALRAGFGIGASQLGIVMHRDLRSSRRIRLLFDQLATRLSAYAQDSCFAK